MFEKSATEQVDTAIQGKPIDEKSIHEANQMAQMIYENLDTSEEQNDFIKMICEGLVEIRIKRMRDVTNQIEETQQQIERDQTNMQKIRNANESLMDFVHPPKIKTK